MHRSTLIETLEDRRLFSVSFARHVVQVVGSGGAPNTITVGLTPDASAVVATVSYPSRKGIITQTKTIPLSKTIRLINITGGNKSDLITIDQTNGSFPILTHIKTHNGNDTVSGGDEPDQILCGNGIDAVMGNGGNDTLLAGKGPDTLVGGAGDDHLTAGRGHDLLIDSEGNNVFTDPAGYNTIQGGSGADTYILKNVKLDSVPNYDPSKDKMKKYVPPSAPNTLVKDILNGLLDYGSFF